MTNGSPLALAQSPPLSVPLRFFITAPVFGVLTGALLLWTGASGLSRWTPAVLAATHLLTLGYMGMVMLGALMQLFPVVIGHSFRRPQLLSAVVHTLFVPGVVLLAVGFEVFSGILMAAALTLLLAAALVFLVSAAQTLANVGVWGDTARSIALALAAFAVTVGFGAWLALGHTSYWALARAWTDIHAAWGLAGWVPLLLMGVAYQVVPMFQVTPAYPRVLRRAFPVLLFAMLLAATLAHGLGASPWQTRLPQAAAGLVLAGFAVATLVLQQRRRRRRPDVTVTYWRVGMVCLILAVLVWLAAPVLPWDQANTRLPLVLGVLMIPGFSLSVINGMLYKIVPFLIWLHLSVSPAAPGKRAAGPVPGVRQIISEERSRLQLRLHALAVVLLVAGVLGAPAMLAAGATTFSLATGFLGLDLVSALRLYRSLGGDERGDTSTPRRASEQPPSSD